MNENTERPEFCTNDMLEFLDDLRESGAVNMFGASPYLVRDFMLTKAEARKVLSFWMATFGQERD